MAECLACPLRVVVVREPCWSSIYFRFEEGDGFSLPLRNVHRSGGTSCNFLGRVRLEPVYKITPETLDQSSERADLSHESFQFYRANYSSSIARIIPVLSRELFQFNYIHCYSTARFLDLNCIFHNGRLVL
jgi:hypothetical protein